MVRVARMLIMTLVLFLLLIPMIICNAFTTRTPRIITILFPTVTFLTILSSLGRATSTEVFLSGAT